MLSEHAQMAILGVVFLGSVMFRAGQHLERKRKEAKDEDGARRWLIIQWVGLMLAFVATTVVFYVRVIRHNR